MNKFYINKLCSFLLVLVLSAKTTIAQNSGCIDINNRIRYSYSHYGGMLIYPISATTNLITGGYYEPGGSSMILSKTYLDNIVWSKKYKTNAEKFSIRYPYVLPNNNIILINDNNVSNGKPYLTCIDNNGNLLWSKSYNITLGGDTIISSLNLLTITATAIYLLGRCEDINNPANPTSFTLLAKLDFSGNVLWSKFLPAKYPKPAYSVSHAMVNNDIVTILHDIAYANPGNGRYDSVANIITKFDANSGDIISSNRLKVISDGLIEGLTLRDTKQHNDGSITAAGNIAIKYTDWPGGIATYTRFPFVVQLSKEGIPSKAVYYKQNSFNIWVEKLFGINNNKKVSLLGVPLPGPDNPSYFLTIDSSLKVKRTRYYSNLVGSGYEHSFHFDDNETIYFSFSYSPSPHETNLLYTRLNNLAPANTLDCFGRDTLVTTEHPFTMVKDTFQWKNVFENKLYSTPVVLTEEPFTINQETICTQTSICDSIKIKGNQIHCLNETAATFTLYKNPQCLRKINWVVDTAFIKIISQPDDTTINVKFLQPYHGFIKAEFEGCALKDSLFLDVNTPQQFLDLGKDSTLCPNKTITLNTGIGFKTYKWQDNSTNSTLVVTQPGTYFVEAADSCNNLFKDTIVIKPMDINFDLIYPAAICQYDTATVTLNPLLTNYSWLPSALATKENNTLKLFPGNNTFFNIRGERYGCILADTIFVKVEMCSTYIYIPTAFTPNNDNRNDTFKPIISGLIEQFDFSIYNRYGQRIFKTNNIDEGWNGTLKGIPQQTGIFVWRCSYKFKDQETIFKKGTVTLIK